jgi:hypothetical protein
MEMQVRVPLLAIVMLAGCVATPVSTPSDMSPRTSPPQSARASLALTSHQPEPDDDGTRLTGALGADGVEGGCAYLMAPDGTRHEVIYPDGWRVELSPLRLLDPKGGVVARGGGAVTVVGQPADDMASTCQIGPIFRATEVER